MTIFPIPPNPISKFINSHPELLRNQPRVLSHEKTRLRASFDAVDKIVNIRDHPFAVKQNARVSSVTEVIGREPAHILSTYQENYLANDGDGGGEGYMELRREEGRHRQEELHRQALRRQVLQLQGGLHKQGLRKQGGLHRQALQQQEELRRQERSLGSRTCRQECTLLLCKFLLRGGLCAPALSTAPCLASLLGSLLALLLRR